MSKFVYLAGPIIGCTIDEANKWRKDIPARFNKGTIGISPLRSEPLVGDKYDVVYDDPRFGTAPAIAAKNEHDVRNCDIVLAYIPKEASARRPAYGSIIEIAWAMMLNKSIILVTDDPVIAGHPLITANVRWIFDNFDDAVDVVNGLFTSYIEAA